jgi:mannose-6-phosphate isomerase-like protein (cupin superfamily)
MGTIKFTASEDDRLLPLALSSFEEEGKQTVRRRYRLVLSSMKVRVVRNRFRGGESEERINSKRCLGPSRTGTFARHDKVCARVLSMDSKKPVQDFPYTTHLNVLYKPLEIVDVQKLVETCTDKWYNQTLCQVNDSVVRLGVIQGEYHWHEHKDLDEFFYVVEGRFLIDLEDRVIELAPRQGFVVPKGLRHRTRAPGRTVILMVEGADIIPAGD